jgi:predicted nucleic acid-binding protein
MTIVDTSVWIDYVADTGTSQVLWLKKALERETVGLTDLILYEILQGVRDNASFEAVRDRMAEFEQFATITPGLEIKAARNYRSLRHRGLTVRKAADCLVATFCIEGGHKLLHNDRDFDGFEKHLGLKVIHPQSL